MKSTIEKGSNYGIAATKRLIFFLATIIFSVVDIDKNRDGEISNSEKISTVTSALPGALSVAGDFPEIKKETARGELTDDEVEELIDYAVSLPMLPDDRAEAEQFIDMTILWANYNRRYAVKAIAFFKRNVEEVA